MEPQPRKDAQTVTAEWVPVRPPIHGFGLKRLTTVEDERGEICEVYRPAWGLHEAPLVYVYQAMVRPRKVKGWIVHRDQDDRIFVNIGTLRWVLYDNRSESPTYQQLDVFTFSDRSRVVFVIPRGVYHAVQNVGVVDAYFTNMPTRPSDHADPDKYRLPLKNDLIPFVFGDADGW